MKQSELTHIKNCPLCGSTRHDKYLEVTDYSTSGEEFTIVQCQDCELLFTNPRPSQEAIGRYYQSPAYISHTNSKTGIFASAYQIIRSAAISKKLSWIEKYQKQPGNILDYGSGTGEFLNRCKSKGWNTHGIELAEAPRNKSIVDYQLKVDSPDLLENIPNDSFDVITLWHVLEHVDKLRALVDTLIQKLKAGGIIVFAQPNPESWDAKYYGKYWAAWDVPIHYYHFKKKNIIWLSEATGLKLKETINMPFDAYYISLLSEEYKAGKKNWIKAVVRGVQSNRAATGRQNASSLTYILEKPQA